MRFQIDYLDPETQEPKTHVGDYEDWTGRALNAAGDEVGPVLTITAREWAQDHAYSLVDKAMGSVRITEVRT
jgi:hypothetical protein